MISDFIVAAGWENNQKIGICHIERVRGTERISFEYEENWLMAHPSLALDPDLMNTRGVQYVTDKKCFGFLSDIAPDRWGRKLMERMESEHALEENRSPVKLQESDFILNVSDRSRQGGIRLMSFDGNFYSVYSENDIPPITELRALESASFEFENNNGNVKKWISQLIHPGSSLGGARPKANVIDTDNSMWIAKFPSKYDDIDVGAWEMVCHDLADMCGLEVPPAKLIKLSEYHTFLSKRFDRGKENKRFHFASAMTLLGKTDNSEDISSYLDLVDLIEQHCGLTTESDLKEMWKRMIFNICVGNTDDHLRNHGFILSENDMWKLSPAYDINPSFDTKHLSLSIDGMNTIKSLKNAIEVSEWFRIGREEALCIAQKIKDIVSSYRDVLIQKYGISRQEAKRMESAFSQADHEEIENTKQSILKSSNKSYKTI